MKLTKKQTEKLWGVTGPYSEVKLILATRILDDRVSRIFLLVQVTLNPFTYELIRAQRELFTNLLLQQLLDTGEYQGPQQGYVCYAFQQEYRNDQVMQEARQYLEYAKQTVLFMHRFVLKVIATDEREKQ